MTDSRVERELKDTLRRYADRTTSYWWSGAVVGGAQRSRHTRASGSVVEGVRVTVEGGDPEIWLDTAAEEVVGVSGDVRVAVLAPSGVCRAVTDYYRNHELAAHRRRNILIGAGVAVGLLLVLVVAASFLFGPLSKLEPEQIAKQWVESNVDAAGEAIAGFVVAEQPLLTELGGEYIEDRIHDAIRWEYSAARGLGGAMYEVDATATSRIEVDLPVASGYVEASLPFVLRIDHDAQEVVSWRPDPLAGRFSSNLPLVSEIAGVAAGMSDAKAALEAGDCIGAARSAGVPDTVIELLEKPTEDRSFVERSLIDGALSAAGLSEDCADLTE